jgi:isoleucyl-tRNA synthetase
MSPINYSKTVNLPQTAFPMKGDMARREPQWLELWSKLGIYDKLQKQHKDDPLFILHDGPPYANGPIHIGHALNKILKDIIVKFKTLSGHRAPYIPGWDCHGLPIENQLMKDLKANKHTIERGKFRKEAARFASKYIELQKQEFIRLGIFGDWERPYLTMDPAYEAGTLKAFFELLDKDCIYRDKKPVYWCPYDETALADAEVEYEDKPSDSAYVRFPVSFTSEVDDMLDKLLDESAGVSALIWTTTPWTLPANVGLAFHPRERYVLVNIPKHGKCYVAERRVSALSLLLGISLTPSGVSVRGEELVKRIQAQNPLTHQPSTAITAEFVSMEDGTGIVHIAPGHGEDDYTVGHLQNKLPIFCPVDERGRFTKEVGVPALEGKHVLRDANEAVLSLLEQAHALVHKEKIRHSYPCCWRCKNPVIYRATEQWFLSMEKDGLREQLVKSLESVRFTPPYGVNRIKGMLEVRPDWCLTRQRYWGTPLPVAYCTACGKPYFDKAFQAKVLEIISKEGSDAWFERPMSDFLPAGAKCSCGKSDFKKEDDILDVWFDSGSSWKAVLENKQKWKDFEGIQSETPVMYLEGSDQHRGWFQTSLIPSVALTGKPPFNQILTHGFVVDGEGQKMSKSLGNVISPQEVTKKYGADILRLWVGYSDYANEIRASDKILEQVTDSYRRFRNTFRYLLGNLVDFDPSKHSVSIDEMDEFDRWALHTNAELIRHCLKNYENYEFHKVMHGVTQFCINDLSGFYLDVQKDVLYCEALNSKLRRSAQTAFFGIAHTVGRLLAPILSFTMEEVWGELARMKLVSEESVFLSSFSAKDLEKWIDARFDIWTYKYLPLRYHVNPKIEDGRKNSLWGSSSECEVRIGSEHSAKDYIGERDGAWWARFLGVSKVTPNDPNSFDQLNVLKAVGQKCPRCWRWREDVGQNKDFPELCARCANVVSKMNLAEIQA